MRGMLRGILMILLLFIFFSCVSQGYEENQCELIAKDFQEKYGGNLVYMNPVTESGAYQLCDYCGHWINSKYISGNHQVFYFDAGLGRIFSNKTELKNQYGNVDIWDFGLNERPPFPLIHHT